MKYGQLLEELFTRPGGGELRARIDDMSNPEYQRLLRCTPSELRERLPEGSAGIASLLAGLDDQTLTAAICNLGGHDLAARDRAFAAIDDTRPTVIFAYTIKGYGLPTQGHPRNHSAQLATGQLRELAGRLGTDPDRPWGRSAPDSEEGRMCAATSRRLQRPAVPAHPVPAIPPCGLGLRGAAGVIAVGAG